MEIRNKQDLGLLMFYCEQMSQDPNLEECTVEISAQEKVEEPKKEPQKKKSHP